MIHYVIFYELSGNSDDCKCREKNIIENITSYPGSTKLLDNTYYINSFEDINMVQKKLSNGLNDDDKMIIAQVKNIIGKRTPNV